MSQIDLHTEIINMFKDSIFVEEHTYKTHCEIPPNVNCKYYISLTFPLHAITTINELYLKNRFPNMTYDIARKLLFGRLKGVSPVLINNTLRKELTLNVNKFLEEYRYTSKTLATWRIIEFMDTFYAEVDEDYIKECDLRMIPTETISPSWITRLINYVKAFFKKQ